MPRFNGDSEAYQLELPDTISLKPSPDRASKNDARDGKADLSHCPQVALTAMAKAFEVGEKKYGRYNYYKGHDASQLVAAAMRHLTAWMDGEENDPTDKQPHLGSVLACVAMILKQQQLNSLKDNRYKPTTKGDNNGL